MGEVVITMEDAELYDRDRLTFEDIIAQEFPRLTEDHLNQLATREAEAVTKEKALALDLLELSVDPLERFDTLLKRTPERGLPTVSGAKLGNNDNGGMPHRAPLKPPC